MEEKQAENEAKAKKARDEKRMAELIKAAEYEEANRERLEEEARMLEQLEKERQIRSAKIDEFNGLIDSKRHHTTFLLQDLTRLQSERADYTEQSLNQR